MVIRLRDDDIIIKHSSQWDNIVGRFYQVHKWCKLAEKKLLHVCAILVDDIQLYPDAVDYVKDEVNAGFIEPQIHGKEHIDYAKLSKEEVREHLKICKEFIQTKFESNPTIWYTPWGASAPHLHEAAKEEGLELVDCSKLIRIEDCVKSIRHGNPVNYYNGKEIFTHFWAKGARVKRLSLLAKYGNWEQAVESDPRLFG